MGVSEAILANSGHGPRGHLIGATELGRMFGKSDFWGRKILRRWQHDQEVDNRIRVHIVKTKSGQVWRYTSLEIIQRYMPGPRDMGLVHGLERLDRDITFLAKKLDAILQRVEVLERILEIARKEAGKR